MKLEAQKSRSANVQARKIEELEKRAREIEERKKTQKFKERGSANAKAQILRPKKECEMASAKSFPSPSSAKAQTRSLKKGACPALLDRQENLGIS
jgi:hypothetical protein